MLAHIHTCTNKCTNEWVIVCQIVHNKTLKQKLWFGDHYDVLASFGAWQKNKSERSQQFQSYLECTKLGFYMQLDCNKCYFSCTKKAFSAVHLHVYAILKVLLSCISICILTQYLQHWLHTAFSPNAQTFCTTSALHY